MFTLFYNGEVAAQSCPGETLQFRETFGAGAGITSLAPGRTNYIYRASGSLADGDYQLRNNTQGRPEWYNVTDHTGDADGRMMVTNASYTPGEFYRDTVFGLTSTKTYTVYFYAMNVNTPGTCSPNPILPRLELVVESYNADGTFTPLSTIVSDSLPQTNPATWVRISGTYYLPTAVTAIRYRIINNSTGGCGNDLAIDDITFSQCQPAILPASGLSLQGKKEKNAIQLNWTAKDEYQSFDIEKAENGTNWTFVKKVISNVHNRYKAEDVVNGLAPTQYRISAISANGRRYYSNVITVKEQTSTVKLSAFPNPFFNELKVQMNADKIMPGASLRLFDIHGKLVSTRNWNLEQGENILSLGGMNIQPGIYFVSVSDRDGAVLAHQRILRK